MKKLILILTLMLSGIALSQSTVNPDTVCINTSGSNYFVPTLGVGYTYTWTVSSPGSITSGQGTESIIVDWSSASAGLIANAVSVVASTPSGCDSRPRWVYLLNNNRCVSNSTTNIGSNISRLK